MFFHSLRTAAPAKINRSPALLLARKAPPESFEGCLIADGNEADPETFRAAAKMIPRGSELRCSGADDGETSLGRCSKPRPSRFPETGDQEIGTPEDQAVAKKANTQGGLCSP
jgi:hypothetical protein